MYNDGKLLYVQHRIPSTVIPEVWLQVFLLEIISTHCSIFFVTTSFISCAKVLDHVF